MSIKVINICKQYGNFKALNDISFEIKKNTITSIVGHNGSGKTTLVKCLSTLLIYESGKIDFFGEEYSYKNFKHIRKRISLLLDASRNLYFNLTLLQNIKYFLGINKTSFKQKEDIINHFLERFSLIEHKNKLVSSLSKGMQQKTALIIALTQESDLVILDEPNLGLDLEALRTLKDILREEVTKKTIILTTQDIKLIEDVSEFLTILNKGRLVFSGTMNNFNSLSDKRVCSFYLDKVPTESIKIKIANIGSDIQCKDNVMHGNFKKENIDLVLNILKKENYKVLDIKTHEGFENSLITVLKDRSNNKDASVS